jgi:signal peptidase I
LSVATAAGGGSRIRSATLRELLDALIVTGLVALFLVTFVIRTFYIPSVSMVPTLQVRDVLLVDEVAYRFGRPHDGDIAVFLPPIPSGGKDFIKRIVGVPGDAIKIRDGAVYRNGTRLREPYENEPPNYDLAIADYAIVVNGKPLSPKSADVPPRASWQAADRIPDGFYFVLGDNRNYSDDSHVWGFVRARSFAGRAFAIIWPTDRLAVLTE